MKIEGLAAVLIIVVFCGCQSTFDFAIVPGERVGPYWIGSDTDLSESAIQCLLKEGLGLVTGLEGTNRVSLIMVTSTKYRTEPGRVRVGESAASARRIFGIPLATSFGDGQKIAKTPALTYNGIWFLVPSNRIESIWVCPKQLEEGTANQVSEPSVAPAPQIQH